MLAYCAEAGKKSVPNSPKPVSAGRLKQQRGTSNNMSSFPEILIDRYRRFRFRNFEPNAEQYEDLATHGQSPSVMMISCCDSRVDPETIFSAMPGELFVVRNVANLVPPYETSGQYHGVSAAIEFAVLNLRVKHIVIMGHSGCGGIKAAMDRNAAIQTEAQFISNWMSMLDEARNEIADTMRTASADEQLDSLEKAAIRKSIENLRTFPFVNELEERGRLALHGAHFDIKTGVLEALNHSRSKFYPV